MLRRLSLWACVGLCLHGKTVSAADEQQPEWTRARLFQGGQIYVIPPESVRLEYNLKDVINLDGTGITGFHSTVGAWTTLPMRWQIGVLFESAQAGLIAPLVLERETVTLDWAWARWGALWGNPVLALGFMRGTNVAPEGYLRLTVGHAVRGNWRTYGALQISRELAGFSLQQMYQIRAGLAWQSETYPITWSCDAGLGMEDTTGSRFKASEYDFWFTPTFAWEPWPRFYVVASVGFTSTTDKDNGTSTSTWTTTPEGFMGYHFE